MSNYLIANEIIFDSNKRTLNSKHGKTGKFSIGSVASRCLKILLDAKGETVKKREIIHKAWGDFGLEVTDNSLTQAVRQIRIAIKETSFKEDLIETIPRIGYRINASIEVSNYQLEDEVRKVHNESLINTQK